MKAYTVHYRLDGIGSEELSISFLAKNKVDAYDKAVYELIPQMHGQPPYHAYVYSVTYQNGNERIFNDAGCPE